MKTGVLASPTIASDEMQGSVMGMSAKGMDIAAYFLRDKIYSDKVLAVVREYTCNAVDEHKKHKIDKNVEIKLLRDPELEKWFWSVRDYANGLDEHGVRNIFGMYFESTKSGNNESIGGFGIGSKAGMSYSDTFYIDSYHNGTKYQYICTLGAGQKGVPIGEIFDIHSEPTTESGVEIRIEVKDADLAKFNQTTRRFVETFDQDVKLRYEETATKLSWGKPTGEVSELFPAKPLHTKDLGNGYRYNMYENFPPGYYISNNQVAVRMGGVIYTARNFIPTMGRHVTQLGFHVIDVPIGRLTIPISREAIEDTPSNNKVYDDISKLVTDLLEEERKTLKVPNFADILDELNYYNPQVKTDFFQFQGAKAFPDTYQYVNFVMRTEWKTLPRNANNKHTVYLLPDIKNTTNWKERLSIHLKAADPNYVGHFLGTDNATNTKYSKGTDSLDVSDIEYVVVKSMGLPPLVKADKGSQANYLVYLDGYRAGSYTADSLEEYVSQHFPYDHTQTVKWHEKCNSVQELNRRTITSTKGGGIYHKYYTANSQKLIDALYELGWISPTSTEYADAVKRINAEADKKKRMAAAEPNLRNTYFDTDFHPNVIKAVGRNDKNLSRLKKVRNAILAEDSTRARILRKLSKLGSFDGNRRISREDLRKILTLK